VKERSVGNLTKTLAVVSILAPASAHPLGIGDIKLLSALNQNLNAEIALVLSGERPSDIQVHLAPPDKFNEAGVPWSYFLSKIKFQTIVKPNGSVIIKLTSNEALKEPFLDLLLEVSWPKGNLYREFTVLVDPPAVYKEATIPVTTNSEHYQTEEPYAMPQRRRTSANKPQTHFAAKGEYGPTRRNDTLWKVAEQARPDNDVSVEQMMIALYEENPRAFYQKNVNALSAGKVLKVPDRDAILKLSRKQALAEFNRQTKAWQNHLSPASDDSVAVKEEGPSNQLTLVAPADAAVGSTSVVAPGNDQVSANNEKAVSSSPNATDGTGLSDKEDAIQSKIAALEKQLAAMQQIISLKDQQLAALQNQSQAKSGNASVTTFPETVQQDKKPVENEPIKLKSTDNKDAAVDQPVKTEAVEHSKQVETTAQPQIPKNEAESTVGTTEKKLVKSAAAPAIQPVAQPSTDSSNDSYYPIVGAIGATMLSVLGLLWWRKRKVEEEMNTESMFASAAMSKAFGSGAITDSSSNSGPSVTESAFLSEFSTTDFGSFDIDQSEIDPLSEADVYLAYGRFHQAEELIRHAINDFPARDDCKLKLLEIFHATENKAAFENYAKELAQSGKSNELQFWAKVSEMANDICPESSLFVSEGINFGKDETSSAEEKLINLNKNNDSRAGIQQDKESFDVVKGTSNLADTNQKSVLAETSAMDFDLTSFSEKDDIVTDDQKNNESIDFDLSSFARESEISEKPEGKINLAKDTAEEFDFNSLAVDDFHSEDQRLIESIDFDLTSNDSGELKIEKDQSAEDFEGFDFSFDDEDSLSSSTDISSMDEEDINFDLEVALDESSLLTNAGGVSDLTDMDELETKLDLARAYIDMGDDDSAKEIVKEVLQHGTDEQQKIAKTLMADLK
jgi:pilus assembly protein FimV